MLFGSVLWWILSFIIRGCFVAGGSSTVVKNDGITTSGKYQYDINAISASPGLHFPAVPAAYKHSLPSIHQFPTLSSWNTECHLMSVWLTLNKLIMSLSSFRSVTCSFIAMLLYLCCYSVFLTFCLPVPFDSSHSLWYHCLHFCLHWPWVCLVFWTLSAFVLSQEILPAFASTPCLIT